MKLKSIQPELGAILLNIKQIGTEVTDTDNITTADKMTINIQLKVIDMALKTIEEINK